MSDSPSSSEIPFNLPFIAGKELFNIAEAVVGGQLAGAGTYAVACESWMEAEFGARKVLLTHSGTAALELAALLCDLAPGDEVLVPSYTYVSTASAFVLRGAIPVFVDIRPDTLNMDETKIEAAITDRTRVIAPVHYAGVECEMDAIMEIADRHDLIVVEDAAQGVNARFHDRFLGTIGHLGCYSFHETKNFISGEGGALVINNERFLERAEIVYHKGTDRKKFQRGETEMYSWVDLGGSYPPSELVSAFLCAQLEEAPSITETRLGLWCTYYSALEDLETKGALRRPVVPEYCQHNGHMFYILLEDQSTRDRVISALAERRIQSVFHYVPLHSSPMGRKFGGTRSELPVTSDLAWRLLRLPCYYELSGMQQERVIRALTEILV